MKRTRFWSLIASACFLWASAPSASASTLEQIRASGAVRLGYVAEARPFSYRDESGNAAGYAVALCQRVADALKVELKLAELRSEFVQVAADTRFEALSQGNIDILCAGGAPTLARRRLASFSIPVFVGGVGALMRDDAPARVRAVLEGRPEPYQPRWRASLGQALRGQIFDVVRGTTTEAWLAGKLDQFAIAAGIQTVGDFETGVAQVASGRADVLFGDRALLLASAARSPDAGDLVLLDRYFTYEAAALALPRGDEDLRLLVDQTLSQLYRSGEITAVYTPYFGKPSEQTLRFFSASALQE